MNCQQFESIVNELARQQMLEAIVREQALAHTSQCGGCALRWEDERALTQKLRALTIEMNEVEAPARIEGELLIAFQKHKSTGQFTRLGRSMIYDWRYWATAAAAVLLIVIGIASMKSRPAAVAAENPYFPTFGPKMANNKAAEVPDKIEDSKPAPLPKQGVTLATYKPKA
ncbi:MAG: hypothetical protein ACR2HX_05570 [Pyrinomonadaceae bacterium]